ncbi:MAG: DNA recombination protein RmuC [Bacteroidia bacterium]|jgi:DNA recombination protein RmuC
MAISADIIVLSALVLATLVVLSLFISIWRLITTRRALHSSYRQLQAREEELRNLQLAQHQSQSDSQAKDLELGATGAELRNLNIRLDDRDTQIGQLRDDLQGLGATHSEQRDALARAQADHRGQLVSLEATKAQLEEKLTQLQALQRDFTALQVTLADREQQLTQLKTEQHEREDRHQEQLTLLNEARENLKKEFENLANRIFEDKGKSFTSTSKDSLEAMLKPFREQITGFQSRINEVHAESLKGHTVLEKELQKVLDVGLEMNTQASNLTHALKGDKKTAGNWGEAQLERTLELAGLQAGDHYETQAAYRDEDGKRRLPDFVIKLPDNKSLVIDSKVSLIDYDRAIAADTDEERTEALNSHAQAVRNHIDDLSKKDYANLPGMESPDFVLMFMPVEPAYIEAMKHNKDLFNYGYQKGVVMVSHTTLMPILRTVANLWMVEHSNREAKEISSRAGEIFNQVCLVAERLQKLGNTLSAANKHYNGAVRGLAGKQGLHGKVDRFAQLSGKANKKMPQLEELHEEIETDRLEPILAPAETEAGPKLVGGEAKAKVEQLKTDKSP